MKKWLFIIIILVIALTSWGVISTYQKATSPLKADEQKAANLAMELSNVVTIENIDIYRGTNHYMIVQGVTSNDERIIVWLSDNKVIETRNASEGIAREDVLKYLNTNRTPQKIISITLAMENNIPLWEIKFTDATNRYNLYYITYDTGEFFQRITL